MRGWRWKSRQRISGPGRPAVQNVIELEVQTIISERPLFIGPCIIIPLPVIPIMFYKQENKGDVVLLKGSISSLKGDRFSLDTIGATVNSQKFARVEVLEPKIEYII
jgi:hypothetical protein